MPRKRIGKSKSGQRYSVPDVMGPLKKSLVAQDRATMKSVKGKPRSEWGLAAFEAEDRLKSIAPKTYSQGAGKRRVTVPGADGAPLTSRGKPMTAVGLRRKNSVTALNRFQEAADIEESRIERVKERIGPSMRPKGYMSPAQHREAARIAGGNERNFHNRASTSGELEAQATRRKIRESSRRDDAALRERLGRKVMGDVKRRRDHRGRFV